MTKRFHSVPGFHAVNILGIFLALFRVDVEPQAGDGEDVGVAAQLELLLVLIPGAALVTEAGARVVNVKPLGVVLQLPRGQLFQAWEGALPS